MRYSLMSILTLGCISLAACSQNRNSEILHIYENGERPFSTALNQARQDHPSYFAIVDGQKIGDQIVGVQVLGRDVECVRIVNRSTIIIEEDLPLYCYEKGSGAFVGAL